jgi:Lon protease-like protein
MHLTPIPFAREIPLFPLPNCVLFPGVVQPLHIFEPRYRAMMRAAVDDEEGAGLEKSVLALALLKPGWEKAYYASPPIHERICAGRIIAHERLPGGKFNLLLQGVARARVISERPCPGEWGAFRVARLQEVPDTPGSSAHQDLQRRILRQLFATSALKELTVTPALMPLFEDTIPTTRLLDALAFSLVQDVAAKQRLLEASDVATRGELLLRELLALAARLAKSAPAGTAPPWPPELGVN